MPTELKEKDVLEIITDGVLIDRCGPGAVSADSACRDDVAAGGGSGGRDGSPAALVDGGSAGSRSEPAYVPYVSTGGRSLRAELRSAPPPGSHARWSELPEQDRVGRPVSNEELALLFETRRPIILARVKRMLRWVPDHEILEEAVQQAFLEAVRNRPSRPPMPLAWITTVAYRRAINFAERKARQDPEWPRVPELPEERLGHGHAPDPGLWLEATELLRALAELPRRQRDVLALGAAGYTHRETGDRVGLTVRGAENAARRGRRTLRRQLAA